jgi:hypothetical protein
LFLWLSYFVPAPKRENFVPRKTLTVFATPEMASYFEDLSASGGLQKSENTSLGQKRPFRESIV